MAFEQNADGSTRRIFVQLTELNGFAVVDFATHTEVTRVALPQIAAGKKPVLEGGNASHGLAVTADNRLLVVDSRLNSAWCFTAASALQYARRTWMAPCSAIVRCTACSITSAETLSASISSITRRVLFIPASRAAARRRAVA